MNHAIIFDYWLRFIYVYWTIALFKVISRAFTFYHLLYIGKTGLYHIKKSLVQSDIIISKVRLGRI